MKRFLMVLISLFLLIMIVSSCDVGPVVPGTLPPAVFNLLSPLNSEQGILPLLNWAAALYADQYDIKLWKSGESEEYLAQNLTQNSYNLSTSLAYSSLYYWKVIAKNDYGQSESATGAFSTLPQKSGNYVEIKDLQATSDGSFTLVLSGTVSDARGIEIILDYDPTRLDIAPNGQGDIALMNISNALGIITKGTGTITISISSSANFSLSHQEFLRITCDAGAIAGVYSITINNSSEAINENFSQINFNKSDIGYVFIE
ncbi:MAG TPA: hypothetical protein PLB99_11880 [Thermotogota bacterium]|nr:hypothetical protein [Thermotogota bacterium]